MSEFAIRSISAGETRTIRHLILRPHQRPEELVYPGDEHADSFHVGAFLGGRLVGIASVVKRPFPLESHPHAPVGDWKRPEALTAEVLGGTAWQVRGMATLPEVRGRGYGAALLGACVEHAAAQGAKIVWCNARTSALGFYRKLGWATWGVEFLVPQTGPHFVMWRQV